MRIGIKRHDLAYNIFFNKSERFATRGPITIEQWFRPINGLDGGVKVAADDVRPDVRQKLLLLFKNQISFVLLQFKTGCFGSTRYFLFLH